MLKRSEYPGAEIHNNIYTTKLPPLNQNYKNVSKRKVKISDNFDPDDYIKKYDIVKRKIKELGGVAHHYAIYLGNGEVVHISRSEKEKSKGEFGARKGTWKEFIKNEKEIEINHPFIPFKKPDLIQRHIEIALNAKYGKGKYELLGNNCEHFATMCVYGLGMSRQTRRTKTYADYLLQAIQENNQLFKEMESDLIEKGVLKANNYSEIQAESSGSNSNQENIQAKEEIIEVDNNQQEDQCINQMAIPPKE
ncbi:9111_t:CDS:1 [Paraglomus brasilianum]|uniref:phospholipase A2 n=1 Tax=Paraglomus brasilianum TaxID=144538 RepID=A0A9N9C293_9GLOM|nr:9111_t:CDS:1 [Paraglomus brasilianum]